MDDWEYTFTLRNWQIDYVEEWFRTHGDAYVRGYFDYNGAKGRGRLHSEGVLRPMQDLLGWKKGLESLYQYVDGDTLEAKSPHRFAAVQFRLEPITQTDTKVTVSVFHRSLVPGAEAMLEQMAQDHEPNRRAISKALGIVEEDAPPLVPATEDELRKAWFALAASKSLSVTGTLAAGDMLTRMTEEHTQIGGTGSRLQLKNTGRPTDSDYDDAFEKLQAGHDYLEVFKRVCEQKGWHQYSAKDRKAFKSAMRRRGWRGT
jgi:hypothetical protein